ncbi:hypothetical protein [Streptomyces sp. N50]|uniref:hypothetical protein n=1 Tax=Streptomyces sp. N50 TaxID=3081765 RepID=UPI0029624C19|nr:hypothetical protein [Streptomyces sp. N50]WOX14959.1 hypothetical protein R2B38_41665 [Streptomyces sp. N50]
MTGDEAKARLGRLARARAFGCQVGSDQLIQAGLDALLAEVWSPSLPFLAGLARREEPEAPELFDHVLDELGLSFEPPGDPTAARWAHAYWLAEEITNGSLDPATGADLIWTEVAAALDYPDVLQPIVDCAISLADQDDSRTASFEALRLDALQAARDLLGHSPPP